MSLPVYDRWSKDAAICYRIGADCEVCPTARAYGLHKDKTCRMAKAVQQLIERGVEPPKAWRG